MAIGTGNRNVTASQLEPGLLMLCQSIGGRAVALQIVALIALVFVRLARELVIVLVHVAIGAALEGRDFENRVLAFWRVTLVALQLGMSIDERVVGLGVRLDVE